MDCMLLDSYMYRWTDQDSEIDTWSTIVGEHHSVAGRPTLTGRLQASAPMSHTAVHPGW
jgi:hypothetical protein